MTRPYSLEHLHPDKATDAHLAVYGAAKQIAAGSQARRHDVDGLPLPELFLGLQTLAAKPASERGAGCFSKRLMQEAERLDAAVSSVLEHYSEAGLDWSKLGPAGCLAQISERDDAREWMARHEALEQPLVEAAIGFQSIVVAGQ